MKYEASKGLNTYSLDVTALSKGMYVLSLQNEETRLIEKLIIEK
jgi:hypothetical protein